MAIEQDLGSTDIQAWYRVKNSELGSVLQDMVIYDKASWSVYINRTMRDVTDILDKEGHSDGTATIIHLLEYERDGMINKRVIVDLFSEVLGL